MPQELAEKIRAAIEGLIEDDAHLLEIDVNERSITHRFALHLQREFGDWDVDCEYNRNRRDTKRLLVEVDVHIPVETVQTDDTHGKTVYPDIIIHRRGTDINLLVIEVKKTTSQVSNDFDLNKLHAFKAKLGYRHALFLRFVTGSEGRAGLDEERWI